MLNWKLALLALVVIPPLAVISLYFQKKILKYQRRVRKTNSRITGSFNEGIMGAMTTKTLVREEANYGEFRELARGNAEGFRARGSAFCNLYADRNVPGIHRHGPRALPRRIRRAGRHSDDRYAFSVYLVYDELL